MEAAALSRAVVPSGIIKPDLSVKRSLVLDRFVSQRQADRARRQLREREALLSGVRAYEGAAHNRLTSDWVAHQTSADSELITSLRDLRARSRQLVRDNPYAKNVVRVLVNNIIGTGIRLQGTVSNARGGLITKVNGAVQEVFNDWAKARTCHVAGLMSLADIERYSLVQMVTAGEAIVRIHRSPFGGGRIPLALEVIEADRLLDQWQTAHAPNGNLIRMGVEIDEWHRPVAYWFNPKHPGDYQFTTFNPAKFIRVPAEDIIHLYLIDRWPQTRGEPWLHASLRTLHDIGGYEEATIVKARASANVVGFIRQPEPLGAENAGDKLERRIVETEPGTWQTLLAGEDVTGYPTITPDPAVAPFLAYMLRKGSMGVGLTYESFTGDYSQSNYSSSRLGQLGERDNYRVLQGYVIRTLRMRLHAEFCDASALVGEVKFGDDYFSNPGKYQAARFRPRGWSWIDPAKEVMAYRAAVRAGFMTQDDVVTQIDPNGDDFVDLIGRRQREVEATDEAGLVFDTNPAQVNDKGATQVDPSQAGDGAPGSQAAAGEGNQGSSAEPKE